MERGARTVAPPLPFSLISSAIRDYAALLELKEPPAAWVAVSEA